VSWKIRVFGVRHLSPMGAWQLRAHLDRVRPEVVLIEGLTDATELIPDITRKATRPPVAILAYTDSLPVRTLVYPLAYYSPEYQALVWAKEHDVKVEFIDLPSDVFLGLQDVESELRERARQQAEGEAQQSEGGDAAPDAAAEEPAADAAGESPAHVPEPRKSIYEQVAQLAGETDYDTYWERHFEHNAEGDSYRLASLELGRSLRELEEDAPRWRAENIVREAYMRRRIEETIAAGFEPDKIVAVVGAFHAPVMSSEHPAMTGDELASLRKRSSKLTLMPYSYFKLSSQSGY
jgi:pheromone shutdown protein TraB